jgi:signal transduction histidine kinase
MGLGLSIARDIIRAHHGTVSVQSRGGEGTTVVLELPLAGA